MGRHYNRVKRVNGGRREPVPEKLDLLPHGQADRIGKLYGVSHDTITKNGKFAAAVETPGYHGDPDEWRPRSGGYQAPREAPKWTKRRR